MDRNWLRCAIECQDAMGRRKLITVLGEPGGVFVKTPAGEVARLDPLGIARLKEALDAALVAAVRGQLP